MFDSREVECCDRLHCKLCQQRLIRHFPHFLALIFSVNDFKLAHNRIDVLFEFQISIIWARSTATKLCAEPKWLASASTTTNQWTMMSFHATSFSGWCAWRVSVSVSLAARRFCYLFKMSADFWIFVLFRSSSCFDDFCWTLALVNCPWSSFPNRFHGSTAFPRNKQSRLPPPNRRSMFKN